MIRFSVPQCREPCDKFVDCSEWLWCRVGIEPCRQSLRTQYCVIQLGAGVCKCAACPLVIIRDAVLQALYDFVAMKWCVDIFVMQQ